MPFSFPSSGVSQQTGASLIVLLARVAAKEPEAFAALYQATCLKLYGVTLRILKRQTIAEDALQDAYIKIWEKAGAFDPARGSAIAWMTAIARHRALDEVRRGMALVSVEDIAGVEDIADQGLLASERMEQSEERRRLIGCLGGIEEEKRKMILLAYHHGMSREALARQFGRPVATVKTWLRRGLESLKECLGS